MTQDELDKRDARRWRALQQHWKSDYLWYHVFDELERAAHNSVDSVVDDVVEHGNRLYERDDAR